MDFKQIKDIFRRRRRPFRTPRRFRLVYYNENTLNELWTLRFTTPRIIAAVTAAALAVVALVTVAISFTPLRTLLPGYLKDAQRRENAEAILRVDSLEERLAVTEAYTSTLRQILAGDTASDNTAAPPAPMPLDPDSLRDASRGERQLVERLTEQERFNLKVLSPIAAEGMAFFSPVAGTKPVEPRESSPLCITLLPPLNLPVSAICDGTVIDCLPVIDGTWTVSVQHDRGFLSRITGLHSAFVKSGARVAASTPFGMTSEAGSDAPPCLTLELYHNSTRLPPYDYIPFF